MAKKLNVLPRESESINAEGIECLRADRGRYGTLALGNGDVADLLAKADDLTRNAATASCDQSCRLWATFHPHFFERLPRDLRRVLLVVSFETQIQAQAVSK